MINYKGGALLHLFLFKPLRNGIFLPKPKTGLKYL